MIALYIVLLLIADVASKYAFYDLGYLGNIFYPIANHGISYSLLIGQTIYIIFMTIVIFAVVTYMYYKGHINKISYILVIAGGLGNFIDRLMYGFVRDFIYIGDWFPIFNLADIFIFLGCAIIFWQIRNMDTEKLDK